MTRLSFVQYHDTEQRALRHPLQELVVDTFVANDAALVGGFGQDMIMHSMQAQDHTDTESVFQKQDCHSVVLCTGANACGKVQKSLPIDNY